MFTTISDLLKRVLMWRLRDVPRPRLAACACDGAAGMWPIDRPAGASSFRLSGRLHSGQFARAMAEDARQYRPNGPTVSRKARRTICMIAYTNYEYDGRVRRYAETLAQRGDLVDVIALASGEASDRVTELNGVAIHAIFRRDWNESSPWTYASRHLRFLLKASAAVTRLHARRHYDVIHIHNIPDILVFAAWYPKLRGARLILDIHDVIPELFEMKFLHSKLKKFYMATLRALEKLSARFVDHVIISNDLWREKLIVRSVDESRCSVLVNHVDPRIFARRQRTRADGKFIVLFPGSFQWHQGLDVGIRAFSQFRKTMPNAEFHLYGGGNERVETELARLVQELGLGDCVKFYRSVVLDNVVQVIADSDLGVVPKRADSFGNEAYSTKIMEFMSQGVPVVVSRTKIDSFYFTNDDVRFFPSGDSDAMAQAMRDVALDPTLRESLVAHGLKYVEQNSWARKSMEYLDLIDSLAKK